jgi:TolA-binding protein
LDAAGIGAARGVRAAGNLQGPERNSEASRARPASSLGGHPPMPAPSSVALLLILVWPVPKALAGVRSAAPAGPVLASSSVPARGSASAGAARVQESARESLALIAGLLERRLPELALAESQRWIERWSADPDRPLAELYLGESLFQLGRFGEAEGAFGQARRQPPAGRLGELLLRLAQCAFERSDAAACAVFCRELLALPPGPLQPAARALLGDAELSRGRAAEAEAAYAALIAAGESGPAALDALYGGAFAARDLARAEASLERAAEFRRRAPGDPRAIDLALLAADLELARGRPEAAEVALGGLAAALESLEPEVRRGRAVEVAVARARAALQGGRAEQALAALEPALAPDPQSAGGQAWRLLRARAELRAGRPAEALEGLVGLTGSEVEHLAGAALEALGRGAEAELRYLRADDARGDYAAARLALTRGAWAEARGAAERGCARPPGPLSALTSLLAGEACLFGGDASAAVAALTGALRPGAEPALEPLDRQRARRLLAWAALALEAGELLSESAALALEPEPPAPLAVELQYLLGRGAELRADAPEAARRYALALELGRGLEPRPAQRSETLWRAARLADDPEALYGRLLDEDPEGPLAPAALLALAERRAARGESAAALADYDRLLERYPDSASTGPARYGRAYLRFELGQPSAAREDLRALLARGDLTAEERAAALELDLFVGAAELAGGAAEQHLAQACRCLESLAEPTLAELPGQLERSAAASLAWVRAAAAAGGVGAARRMLAEFERHFLPPGGPLDPVLRPLAIEAVHLDLAAPAELERAEARALDLAGRAGIDEPLAEALFFVAEARFAAGQDAAAVGLYRAAEPAAGPLLEALLYKRGFAALRLEDFVGAAADFERLLAAFPNGELAGESAYLLGEARRSAGDLAGAAQGYETLLARWPRHALRQSALLRLGLARQRLGQPREALEALETWLAAAGEAPERAQAELARGRAQRASGALRPARQSLLRVLELDRGALAAEAQLELAELSRAEGALEAALTEYLKLAVLYEPGDAVARALFGAGEVLESLGRPERAREQFAELLRDYPEHPLAEAARQRLGSAR